VAHTETVEVEVAALALTTLRRLNRERNAHAPLARVAVGNRAVYAVPACEVGALGAEPVDAVETGGALALSADEDLAGGAGGGLGREGGAGTAVEAGAAGALHAGLADETVAGQAAAGGPVPLGSRAAELPDGDALAVEGADDEAGVTLLLLAALLSVPVGAGRAGAAGTR
jgi:hypothetical protein